MAGRAKFDFSEYLEGDPFGAALVALAGCLESALNERKSGLTDVIIGVGGDDIDYVGSANDRAPVCGQVWVKINDGISTAAETSVKANGEACLRNVGIGVQMGILRCIKVPEAREPYDREELLMAGLLAAADMRTMHDAITCCGHGLNVSDLAYGPMGPSGAYYGGIWTFTVNL